MMDEELKVYLIEVNENPCLSTLSDQQRTLISSLVNDTIALTIDPIFSLQTSNIHYQRYAKDDPYLTRFELIYTYTEE